jgi:hypothetical protein
MGNKKEKKKKRPTVIDVENKEYKDPVTGRMSVVPPENNKKK